MHQLLQPLERCTLVLDEQEDLLVALDEERFLRKTLRWLAPSASDKKYVSAAEGLAKLFLRTQCCSEHALAIFKR